MKKFLLLSFIPLILFSSCNIFRQSNDVILLTQQKIEKFIAGTDTSESAFRIFYDKELPPPGKANHIEIDTVILNGKKFYTILAEYPNPLYNRFAILDSNSNILLIDKSLNGYLIENILRMKQVQFIQIEENFISKDSLNLKRISLYSVINPGYAALVLRTYTELKGPKITYYQKLTQFTPEEILTKISSTVQSKSELIDSSDKFLFDAEANKYFSSGSKFDSFVITFVANFISKNHNPTIAGSNSLIQPPENIKHEEHEAGKFSIPLSDQWDEIKNVKVSHLMKKLVTGTKYINNQFGAEITVIQLPENDSSENYINYMLVNVSRGNYKVRYSEKIEDGIYYNQFFEYSCDSEKFLLILQTLKSTYETYRSEYQNLINSFSMGC